MSTAREPVLSPGACQGPVVRERWLCLKGKRPQEQGVGSRVAGNDVGELWACGHYRDSASALFCVFKLFF